MVGSIGAAGAAEAGDGAGVAAAGCVGAVSALRLADGRHSSAWGADEAIGCGAGVEAASGVEDSGAAGAVAVVGNSGCISSAAAFFDFFFGTAVFFAAGFAAFVAAVFGLAALVFGAAAALRFAGFFAGADSS